MRFKKVYIEIGNMCNLNCDFCIGNIRKNRFMTYDEFMFILGKIKPFTNYIYLHVLGEPLLHPKINEFIDGAFSMGFNVNITTNGYLINKIKTDNIRQLNISLHSFDLKNGLDLKTYLDNIFNKIDSLLNTYISLRLWTNNKFSSEIVKYVEDRYNVKIDKLDNFKVADNIFLSHFHEFIWPDLGNDYFNENGTCYGLINHIGILCDGTIVPCCLDSKGNINLGNIFTTEIDDVLKSDIVLKMIDGFKKNKKCVELCKHCGFLK
ncbi:MAG: SPASM domain-containing protein [Bacilli bacterium]|nr:SPASM domain-containing protein [Bacilli bacterium]